MNTFRHRGVTIVEGLVALVILSVGMLGIASLYVASLKTGRTALTRTTAVNAVNDILDSIRSNGTAGNAYNTAGRDEAPAVVGACATRACTAEELAENDLANWIATIGREMPAGAAGTVTRTPGASATTPDVYTAEVTWNEPGDEQIYRYAASLEMLPVRP